jgi:hypothetical protein
VFDDNFETVFNDGKASEELDRICNELFVKSRECYAEEEFDEDGILVYRPPSLDEVWLSEPERRERQKSLDSQHERTARQRVVESREVKRRLERSRESVPALEESDVDTDDESLSGDPVFDPGGEDVMPERDMYADHPGRKLDFEDEVDTPEGASPPLQATEEALEESPLGRSVDGRSRRIRKRYLCSMGEKQIPPAVRQEMHLWRIS